MSVQMSVKRLTEKHYKSSDGYYMKCSEHCENAAIQCGECDEVGGIIDRLGTIEDILGDDYDLERLREMVQADREGRCKIIPEFNGKKCGSCRHFKRISGTMRGTCKVRPLVVSRWGGKQLKFEPNQSHLACSKYESALKGEQA